MEIIENRGYIPQHIDATDIYIAINAQYHDYARLFKTWFTDDVECKIVESAMMFWFMDEDYKEDNKIVEYFKAH